MCRAPHIGLSLRSDWAVIPPENATRHSHGCFPWLMKSFCLWEWQKRTVGFPASTCLQQNQSSIIFFFSLVYVFTQTNHRLFSWLLLILSLLLPPQPSLSEASQHGHCGEGLVSGSSLTWIDNLPKIRWRFSLNFSGLLVFQFFPTLLLPGHAAG